MTFRNSVLAGVVALAMLGMSAVSAAASTDSQLRTVISQTLNAVRNTNDFLKTLSQAEFEELVSCMQQVVTSAALRPDKEYVVAGRSRSERGDRLQTILDRRPIDGGQTLRQRVARSCN